MGTRDKIKPLEELTVELERLRTRGTTFVFTNGCFDLLHVGHVRYLREARALADRLVVAINTDASVARLKGPGRPIQCASDRAEILAALACVDFVTFFGEETPLAVIERLRPDVLVKGADWPVDKIVGRECVEATGGRVATIPYVEGMSTTEIIRRIREGVHAGS